MDFLISFCLGFWIKNKVYVEQPVVNYQYRFIVLLESADTTYLASSYENINQIYSNEFRSSIRSVNEIDPDSNGYKSALSLNITIGGIDSTTNNIRNAKILLLFNVGLSVSLAILATLKSNDDFDNFYP